MILTITLNPAIDKVYFVDEFIMGYAYRPKNISITAGGKGLNVSRVASILGEKVLAMGFLGENVKSLFSSQLKNWANYFLTHLIRYPLLSLKSYKKEKNLMIPSVGNRVEKIEPLYNAGRNVN